MARKDKKQQRSLIGNSIIRNNLDLLDRSLSDLYRSTYYTDRSDLDDTNIIQSDIEKSIENIMHNNLGNSTINNMSRLYSKLSQSSKEDNDLLRTLQDLNDDTLTQSVLASWITNKWVKDLNDEIDMVLKYAPKLREALLCKKDCILSADHFSKDFLNFTNILATEKEELFNKRIEELKNIYKLPEKIEQWYDTAQTYGECYLYIVPYSSEFERLLKNKNNVLRSSPGTFSPYSGATNFAVAKESNILINEASLRSENSGKSKPILLSEGALNFAQDKGLDNIKITINMNGLLESATNGIKKAEVLSEAGVFNRGIGKVFTESVVLSEANNKYSSNTKIADKLVPDDLEFDDKLEDERTSSEMLITGESKDQKVKINVPGCIVKELKSENLLPQYIEDICLGYFYIEVEGDADSFDGHTSFEYAAGLNTVSNNKRMMRTIDQYNTQNKSELINYISGRIYDMIDPAFINNNQELRKELYMILKHNELFNSPAPLQNGHIKVSFLSADDVIPIIFNWDKETHRGKSDLEYSLFPAKLYSALYITNVLSIITRGQDKRVYYVKQNVETNISKTVLNVINQIKKGNFGARQFENLGNILNITGKFNDIVMPTNSSGEPPVTMEILEGQRFTDNSELMSMLEKQMIDPTDVPYDLIESRQSLDYAIQATMSNSKLMRTTYKRQDSYEDDLSLIVTRVYNYEYEENEEITVTLPAPSFLNATNGQQLVEGTISFLESIVNSELADESDEVKAEFKRLGLRYYIPTHLNLRIIDRFKTEAKINVAKRLAGQEEG